MRESATQTPVLKIFDRKRFPKKKPLIEFSSYKYQLLRKRLLQCLRQIHRKDAELSLLKNQHNLSNNIFSILVSFLRKYFVLDQSSDLYSNSGNNQIKSGVDKPSRKLLEMKVITPQEIKILPTNSCEKCKKVIFFIFTLSTEFIGVLYYSRYFIFHLLLTFIAVGIRSQTSFLQYCWNASFVAMCA